MVCPNCSGKMNRAKLCPHCGIDPVLYSKTCRMSDTLYNKGLNQARANDMSGALDSLMKSIEFNKNNVQARNLLGLIHYEVGHIGDALKQWVISASLLREQNFAATYLEAIQADDALLEQMSEAVRVYNQALEYLRQKSDDLAIIQLKRALELNPKLIDALNLLTLCHLIQRDKERAKMLTERVLSLDANNPIALQYYKELFPTKIRPEAIQKVKKNNTFEPILPADRKSFGETFHFPEIIAFAIGAICAFAITYILVVPGMTGVQSDEITRLTNELTTAESRLETESAAAQAKISELEAERASLRQENETFALQAAVHERAEQIHLAATLWANEQAVEAARLLRTLNTTGLSVASLQEADRLRAEIYPVAAEELHLQATSAFTLENFTEARMLMAEVMAYIPEDAPFMDSVLYHQGRLYEQDENFDEARQLYERLLTEHVHSTFRIRTQNQLNGLPAES